MNTENKPKIRIKTILLLHILLMFYSVSGILSKKASGVAFLSKEFCLFYAGIILILGIYAIGWQQVIKRLPLTFAFANKAVTVIWGIIWGLVFFSEPVTFGKVAGAILIIAGVVLFAYADIGDEK